MSKSFMDNVKKGKWVLGGLFGAILVQDYFFKQQLKEHYFGIDGMLF